MIKYEVCFAMCHCEYTNVELDEEDIEGKTEGEIEALVESLAWRQIKQECTEYDPDEIIEINKVEDSEERD
jgi:hypothetical protein